MKKRKEENRKVEVKGKVTLFLPKILIGMCRISQVSIYFSLVRKQRQGERNGGMRSVDAGERVQNRFAAADPASPTGSRVCKSIGPFQMVLMSLCLST